MTNEHGSATPPASGHALLIDPSVNGQSHILVNTGFIDIALKLYKDVTVVAKDSHVDALLQYMEKASADRVAFVKYQNRSEVAEIYKEKIEKIKFSKVLFLNIDHSLYYKINMYNLVKGRYNLYWVGHSHFLTFEDHGAKVILKNKIKKLALFNILFKSKIIVCGNNIKRNVDSLVHHADKVRAIFHPIGIAPIPQSGVRSGQEEDVFSLLHINGWHEASEKKVAAIHAITEIAARKKLFNFTDVKSSVATDQDERYFSRDYRDRLDIVSDYSFFLHLPENTYRLQASGALMDMLLTGTPVIGLQTDFGEEMTTLIGQFGHFFESFDDIVAFLQNVDPAKLLADRGLFSDNLKNGYEKVKAASLQQAKRAFQ